MVFLVNYEPHNECILWITFGNNDQNMRHHTSLLNIALGNLLNRYSTQKMNCLYVWNKSCDYFFFKGIQNRKKTRNYVKQSNKLINRTIMAIKRTLYKLVSFTSFLPLMFVKLFSSTFKRKVQQPIFFFKTLCITNS